MFETKTPRDLLVLFNLNTENTKGFLKQSGFRQEKDASLAMWPSRPLLGRFSPNAAVGLHQDKRTPGSFGRLLTVPANPDRCSTALASSHWCETGRLLIRRLFALRESLRFIAFSIGPGPAT